MFIVVFYTIDISVNVQTQILHYAQTRFSIYHLYRKWYDNRFSFYHLYVCVVAHCIIDNILGK